MLELLRLNPLALFNIYSPRLLTMTSKASSKSNGLTSRRIEALADGVFAIVLTLLVLDIRAPLTGSEAALLRELVALWPKLFSYFISFVILGIFWFGHHMEFHYIRRSDRIHIWLNLLFLMAIAFVPFSAALLGNNLQNRVAIAVYGGNLAAAGLVRYIHWRYATQGRRLVDSEMDGRVICKVQRVFLIVPFIYLLAIGLSWISISASLVCYALIPVLYIRPPREDRYLTSLRRRSVPEPGSKSRTAQQ